MTIRRVLFLVVAVLAAAFLLIQFIPYGRAHDNPPVISEPNWDSPQTREVAQRACFDCHSNETVWPWYSNIAPVSWLVQHDTDEGRLKINFSEWGQGNEGEEAEELSESVMDGEMPMSAYLITHPEARLSDAERVALAGGLAAIGSPSGRDKSEHDD